jgi:integrase
MATFSKRGKKGNETWTVVFDLPGHYTRKQKRLSGFKTKQEANFAYLSFVANYKPCTENDNKNDGLLFEELFNIYKKALEHSVKESTLGVILSDFKLHINPFFNGRRINDITTIVIDEWVIELDGEGFKYKTKKRIVGFLRAFFNYCIEKGIIKENPCKRMIKLVNKEIKKEMSIWTEEEFKQFISSITNDIVYKAFFSFLYLTGCRRGEALALRWNDIKGDNAIINKTIGYNRLKGGLTISSPKNAFSNRKVVMPQNLVELLNELKEYYKQFDMFSEDNYVFGNLRPLPPETIRRKLQEYCQKTGVKPIRIHDFRHSHASLLISKGHDIVSISKRLGHADVEITLKIYAHQMPNKQTEIANDLNYKL